jgi:hypothetical protein
MPEAFTNPTFFRDALYTLEEFGGFTQKLGQHDGQISSNAGENKIPVRFVRIGNTIL